MLFVVLKELLPVISQTLKALKDKQIDEDERDQLLMEAALAIADILKAVASKRS